MRYRWLVPALAVAALAVGIGVALWVGPRGPDPVAGPAVGASAQGDRPVTVVAAGPDADRVGARMRIDDAVADDLLFLVVAALRGRCQPAHAHELPRMAVLARLPTLAAGQGPESAAATWRRDVSHVVNDVVRQAGCAKPLSLRIGAYVRVVDPEVYAQAFPDSYFDPGLTVRPLEAHGAPLAQRLADPCATVAYAVLPLDDVRAWQCTGLRAQARSAVINRCHAGGASPDEAAADIQRVVSGLPATCQ